MGFWKIFKKVINPLTPFKVAANTTKAALQGNPMGALKASIGMSPGSKSPGQMPWGAQMASMLASRYGQQGPWGMQPGMQPGQEGMAPMLQGQYGGWSPQPGGGGFQPLPALGQEQMQQQAPQAPAQPPAEQPTDYQALAEEKKRKQEWRSGLASNKAAAK